MIHIEVVPGKYTDKCLLVFSPLAANTSSTSFGWWKQLESNNFAKVFVRDDLNSWYLSWNNKTVDIESILEALREAINKVCDLSSAEIICIGASMGGFAAFLYGSLLKAKLCWATSIEETLMLPGSISARHLKNANFGISLNTYLIPSVNYQLFVGELDLVDLFSASLLPDYVNVRLLSNGSHVVPLEMAKRNITISTMLSLFINDFYVEDTNTSTDFHTIRKDVFYYYSIAYNADSLSNLLVNSFIAKQTNVPIFNYYIAQYLFKNSRKLESLNILESSLVNNEFLTWEMYHFIGLVYRDCNILDKALYFFKKAQKLNPNSSGNNQQILQIENKT